MAKTAAERQALCRMRRNLGKGRNEPEFQLNTYLTSSAYFALERASRWHGITKKELLEHLLCAESERIVATFEGIDSCEWKDYFQNR